MIIIGDKEKDILQDKLDTIVYICKTLIDDNDIQYTIKFLANSLLGVVYG